MKEINMLCNEIDKVCGEGTPVGIMKPEGKEKLFSVELYKSDWMNLTKKELISLLEILKKGFKRFYEEE